MKTNVQIPAGITKGTEAFWIDGEKWLIHNGESKPFNDYPAAVQNAVVALFRADTESRAILEKYKIKGFIPQFEAWYKCVVGGLDSEPDFKDFCKTYSRRICEYLYRNRLPHAWQIVRSHLRVE